MDIGSSVCVHVYRDAAVMCVCVGGGGAGERGGEKRGYNDFI